MQYWRCMENPDRPQRVPIVNRRPLCILALGFIGGLLLYTYLPGKGGAVCALILLALAVAGRWSGRKDFALFLLLAALGLIRAMSAALTPPQAGVYTLTGTIAEAPEPNPKGGYWLLLSNAQLDGAKVDGRIRLTADAISPAYGQRITCLADVRPANPVNTWYAYTRVSGVAEERDGSYAVLENGGRDPYGMLLDVRAFVGGRIDALFPDSRGAARGMLLGDKSGLDEDLSRALYGAGVGHLLAVSGLHVTVLAGALLLALRRVSPTPRFYITGAFLLFYALLTAGAPSVIRACMMLLITLAAPLLYRRPDPLSALCLAALLILIYRPAALFYAGFQLSFLAALSIILLAPLLYARVKALGTALAGTLSGSVAVTLGTLPAVAGFFGSVPLLSVITNLFVLPLVPLFLIPGFIAAAAGCLYPPLGRLLAVLPNMVLTGILALSQSASQSAIPIPGPSTAAYLCFVAAMFALSRYCLLRPQWRFRLFSGLLLVSLLLWR